MDNCSLEEVDSRVRYLQPFILLPVFVVGLILNMLALLVFSVLLRKWTESTIYATNLTLMDLLMLVNLPFKVQATRNAWAPDKSAFCSFLESLYFFSMYGSIYTMVCIAVDRYVMICHPFQAKQLRSPRKAVGICATIWVLVGGASTQAFNLHKASKDFKCFHKFSKKAWNLKLIACLEVFGFLLPALVLAACSAKIIHSLRLSQRNSGRNHACLRAVYSSLCAFLVPFAPSHLAIFLQYLVHSEAITSACQKANVSLFLQLSMSLASVTCCLDALCYYFTTREVRTPKDALRMSISRWRSASASEV